MERRRFIKSIGLGTLALTLGDNAWAAKSAKRPNIIWIMSEDICPDLSCYGVKGVQTPNLDKLASQGARYTNAFSTSPVCSPSRSAMLTGMHQNTVGAHQHRTNNKKPLPAGVKPITHLLEEAGYFTCLMDKKTDHNFTTEKKLFMGKDFKERKADQPFFAQLTYHNTHRSWRRDTERPIDVKDVEIPPYYPDVPMVRRDWANGLEEIQMMDRMVGNILKRLDNEGLADNTVVFFIGDHGRCHIRGKQFLYDGGIHVPLIMRWPGRVNPGAVIDDLVMSIDVSATILSIAGVKLPDHLQGQDILSDSLPKRQYVFAARDKMDDTHDSMRAVRSKDYKYILNLMPERPWCQFNRYKEDQYPMLALMNVMNMKGQLNSDQARFMAASKPIEELYDLKKDPHEINNVADDPKYKKALADMQKQLARFRKSINDQGVSAEFREGGWPATYPTKSLQEWQKALDDWKAHLLEGKSKPKITPNPKMGIAPKTKSKTRKSKKNKSK